MLAKILATVQQLFFLVLGYGLLTLRRWSLFIYVGIAVLQIFNISAYSECYDKAIPPALMALVMVLSCAYVFARRDRFSVQPTPVKPYTPVKRGSDSVILNPPRISAASCLDERATSQALLIGLSFLTLPLKQYITQHPPKVKMIS
jgi:hypothetical protein